MEMDLAHFVTDFVIVKSDEAKTWLGKKNLHDRTFQNAPR